MEAKPQTKKRTLSREGAKVIWDNMQLLGKSLFHDRRTKPLIGKYIDCYHELEVRL